MNLLFILGGSRVLQDTEGRWYIGCGLNEEVWKRYTSVCDRLCLLARKEENVLESKAAAAKYDEINTSMMDVEVVDDIYRPFYKALCPKGRKEIYEQIKRVVARYDKVIIRVCVNSYSLWAWQACMKLGKPFAVEIVEVSWDLVWNFGNIRKLLAYHYERQQKKITASAPYALYVTTQEMQDRYPCPGKTIGCSNVELKNVNAENLEQRIKRIKDSQGVIRLGTTGFFGPKVKGQHLVIKAMGRLKREGIANIEYQLVGGGDTTFLEKVAASEGVSAQVKFVGSMPHDKIFEWLDDIDIYIQPSYQEGLCRSVVEAMSRACPIIASDACGERELTDEKFIFKRGDWKALAKRIKLMISSKETMIHDAQRAFEKSKEYRKEILDKRRHDFYTEFMSE